MPNVKLQSCDGHTYEVDVEIAKCSNVIKTMLEDLGVDEDEEEVIPLPNVNSAILEKVIKWAMHRSSSPSPLHDIDNMFEIDIAKHCVFIEPILDDTAEEVILPPEFNSPTMKKIIQLLIYAKEQSFSSNSDKNKDWDAEFLNVDTDTLFELILAANYLDIEELLDVSCKAVANLVKSKTPDEIRKIFNLKFDTD